MQAKLRSAARGHEAQQQPASEAKPRGRGKGRGKGRGRGRGKGRGRANGTGPEHMPTAAACEEDQDLNEEENQIQLEFEVAEAEELQSAGAKRKAKAGPKAEDKQKATTTTKVEAEASSKQNKRKRNSNATPSMHNEGTKPEEASSVSDADEPPSKSKVGSCKFLHTGFTGYVHACPCKVKRQPRSLTPLQKATASLIILQLLALNACLKENRDNNLKAIHGIAKWDQRMDVPDVAMLDKKTWVPQSIEQYMALSSCLMGKGPSLCRPNRARNPALGF